MTSDPPTSSSSYIVFKNPKPFKTLPYFDQKAMSTRKRKTSYSLTNSSLPPPRKGKAIATDKTTLPFSNVKFNTFIYILSGLALAFISFNAWRLLQLKIAAGGWWNLVLKRRLRGGGDDGRVYGHDMGSSRGGDGGVEDRINALAEALGIPSHELASAIADAVKHHVPPASLSSVSAAEATQSGTAVNILVDKETKTVPGTSMGDRLSAMAFDDAGPELD